MKGQPYYAIRKAARQRNESRLKQATPDWVDKEGLKQVSEACERLSKATKREYHRGHLFPIKGKKVSGLNIPSNLQPELGSVNIGHKNNFVPCRYCDGKYYELSRGKWVEKVQVSWNPSVIDFKILFTSY